MPVKRNLDEGIIIGEEVAKAKRDEYKDWVARYGKEEADKLASMTQEDWDNVELPQDILDALDEIEELGIGLED